MVDPRAIRRAQQVMKYVATGNKRISQLKKILPPTAVAGASLWAGRQLTQVRPGPRKLRGARKPSLHQGVKKNTNGGSWSSFNYGHRKIKNFGSIKSLRPQNWITNTTVRSTSTIGQQQFVTVSSMFSLGQLHTMLTQPSFSNPAVAKMLYQSCAGELLITNQGNGTARISLYDIITRRDANNTTASDPGLAVRSGFGDEVSGSNSNYLIPGVTPFQSQLFTTFYKVIKITNIELSSGQTHTHKYKFKLNKGLGGELIQNQAQATTALKGISCYTMLQHHGYPDDDSANTSHVSLGSTQLDVVNKQNFKYYYTTQNQDTHLATAFTYTSFGGNENVMNEKTGAVVTETSA